MKYLNINLKDVQKKQFEEIVSYLQKGGVIIYPTDTLYGIGCLADNKKAINKIFKIKKRGKKHPLLILVHSYCTLKKYCYVSKRQDEYLRKIWPGKYSVILKHRGLLPEEVTGGLDSLAVRLPKNDFLIKILKKVKTPLVSTSVNISGEKSLFDVSNIEKYFKKDKPDLVIDAGILKTKKSSKLIDLQDIDNIKRLR